MIFISTSDILKRAEEDQTSNAFEVWKCLQEQREQNELCDVCITCSDGSLYAHRCVLAALSPYFKALFTGMMFQHVDSNEYTADLSEFSMSSVGFLLDLLYEKKDIVDTTIDCIEFLQLLDFVQVDKYGDMVSMAIRPHIDIENCLDLFQISCSLQATKLKQLVRRFVGRHFDMLINSDQWRKVTGKVVQELFKESIG